MQKVSTLDFFETTDNIVNSMYLCVYISYFYQTMD